MTPPAWRRGRERAGRRRQPDLAVGIAALDRLFDMTGMRAFVPDGYGLDARRPKAIAEVVDALARDLGGIDIMVNCVGIQREQPLLDVTEAVFDEAYETKLKSAMFLAQAVSRTQIAAGLGGCYTVVRYKWHPVPATKIKPSIQWVGGFSILGLR